MVRLYINGIVYSKTTITWTIKVIYGPLRYGTAQKLHDVFACVGLCIRVESSYYTINDDLEKNRKLKLVPVLEYLTIESVVFLATHFYL